MLVQMELLAILVQQDINHLIVEPVVSDIINHHSTHLLVHYAHQR